MDCEFLFNYSRPNSYFFEMNFRKKWEEKLRKQYGQTQFDIVKSKRLLKLIVCQLPFHV